MEQYRGLLLKWQKTLNLVGPNTLDEAWERHFVDSAQLEPLIPAGARTLFDLGSGAGFPGLVLAMMRPELSVHLVESDERKATFLRTVSRETDTPVIVHMERVEALPASPRPDVVTARALAELDRLLGWCLPWAEGLTMVFPKGEKAEEEIRKAQMNYNFVFDAYPSMTAPEARILRLSALSRKM